MVPMLTCGLVRSNFAFATVTPSDWVTPYDVFLVWFGRTGYSPLAFLMISSATFLGTSAYESNCME
jgi:hypothetical protein